MTPTPSPSPTLKQISHAQLAANRLNAQQSTGPKTESGKQQCRINATRHGLTGQFHAFTHEDKAAFDQHCHALMADLKPETYQEKTLAMSIAENQWRLHRGRALENNIFSMALSGPIGEATDGDSPEVFAAVCQARVWLQDGNSLQLLTLYESRIRRSLEKDTKQLAELQAIRKAASDKALEQAKLLAQLALMKNQSYDPASDFPPAPNGFAFSSPQINRLLDFDQRLKEASFFSTNGWNRRNRYEKPGIHIPKAA